MPPNDQPYQIPPQPTAAPAEAPAMAPAPVAAPYQQAPPAAMPAVAPVAQPGIPSQPGQPAVPGQPAPAATPTKQAAPQNTTQRSLLFSEIRDGMIIMADGSFRAVVACQSINFDLMSSREREGVEYSYQNFLNSLSFDIQILIQSRRVDIAPYIDKLESIRRSQDNMLLNVLMDDYLDFIEQLAEEANIMDKKFFIVVPFSPAPDAGKIVDKGKGFFTKFFAQNTQTVTRIDEATYTKAKDEIKNRVDSVMSGLFQLGVHCAQLNTKELGELYYNSYNPDTAVNQPLGDFEQATSVYVKKGQGEARRPTLEQGSME